MNKNPLSLLWDTYIAKKQGLDAMAQRQRNRFIEMFNYARFYSPYYRQLYQNLPEQVEDPKLLPVTNKKELMAHFDDWVTDRTVTFEKVRAFIDNPEQIGEPFLDKYLVATTSGTSGNRGFFLLDNSASAVYRALTLRRLIVWLTISEIVRLLAGGMRTALVIATGGHFVAFAGVNKERKSKQLLARSSRIFSVHIPLPDLVAQLNEFRPVLLAGYASVIAQLAGEQETGRLNINPVLLVLTGEGLSEDEYERISKAFNAKVRNAYGCTEFAELAYGCEHGWLRLNSDWLVFEPVDINYQPTLPGEQSHTVLLSNLANRVQPILRYDLGDSILQHPNPSPYDNPQPAIRVQGRASEVLTFSTDHGEPVVIVPLAFGSLIDRTPGVEQFQIVQNTPTNLRVRLRYRVNANQDDVWQRIHAEMKHLLIKRKLDHITVERAEEPPEQSPGGKYRTIIPLS